MWGLKLEDQKYVIYQGPNNKLGKLRKRVSELHV
jgi:hypothetical protein